MPASTRTMFTLAHANASARLPKSVMRAHTATPTTQAVRKQHRIGDLELADVDDRQRDGADQDERGLGRRQLEKPRHQADRENPDDRPEEQLEEEEHVAGAHERVAQGYRPDG